jgi:MATE family multidrug resistance protein
LILATSGHALRLFADRVMLSQYAPEALSAAMPAGLTAFCLMSLFIGTAGYAGTFVSQYIGSNQPQNAGRVIWQAIWIALIGGIFVGSASFFSPTIISWMRHEQAVQAYQIPYFEVLVRLSFSAILLAALNAFWSGRGHTRTVMMIELLAAGLNIVLNDALIFGKYGFPELGIQGAGLATSLSSMGACAVALALFFSRKNRKKYGTCPKKVIDLALLSRIIKFGLPNGMQFFLEIVAFNLFVIFLGRFGVAELEAANIAFGINALAFLPLVGLGMASSILVGQCIGAGDAHLAKQYVSISIRLSLLYNLIISSLMLLAPQLLITLFIRSDDPNQAQALVLSVTYMRFIAVYLFFDGFFIIYSHSIRGAGDTRFAMLAGLILSWVTLAIPAWLIQSYCKSAIPMWYLLVIHVMIAGTVFWLRYRQGAWTKMKVVEDPLPHEMAEHIDMPINA